MVGIHRDIVYEFVNILCMFLTTTQFFLVTFGVVDRVLYTLRLGLLWPYIYNITVMYFHSISAYYKLTY